MLGARNLWDQVHGMVGVYLDDPSSVPACGLRSLAGFELVEGAAMPDGFQRVDIPAGPVARLRFRGPYAGLAKGHDYLYCDWLPQPGRDPAMPRLMKSMSTPPATWRRPTC